MARAGWADQLAAGGTVVAGDLVDKKKVPFRAMSPLDGLSEGSRIEGGAESPFASRLAWWRDAVRRDKSDGVLTDAQAEELLRGIKEGVRVGHRGARDGHAAPNLPMSEVDQLIVWKRTLGDVKKGLVVGPFESPLTATARHSPCGTVPKDGTDVRVINHLSHPRAGRRPSVNAGVSGYEFPIRLDTFGQMVAKWRAWGPGTHAAAADQKSAYRHHKIDLRDRELCGFRLQWRDEQGRAQRHRDGTAKMAYFYHTALCFGLKSAGAIHCQYVEVTLRECRRVAAREGLGNDVCFFTYIDDWCVLGRTREQCARGLEIVNEVSAAGGWRMSSEKEKAPCQSLVFLGLGYDGVRDEVFLPLDKLEKFRERVRQYIQRSHTTRQELQQVVGVFGWIRQAMPLAGPMFGFLLHRLRNMSAADRPRRLPRWLRDELAAWAAMSGVAVRRSLRSRARAHYTAAHCDASFYGWGYTYGEGPSRRHRRGVWPIEFKRLAMRDTTYSMNFLELGALMLCVMEYARDYPGMRLYVMGDNQGTLLSVLKGFVADNPTSSLMVRQIYARLQHADCRLELGHVASEDNRADWLSRWAQVPMTLAQTQQYGPVVETVLDTEHIFAELVKFEGDWRQAVTERGSSTSECVNTSVSPEQFDGHQAWMSL